MQIAELTIELYKVGPSIKFPIDYFCIFLKIFFIPWIVCFLMKVNS